MKTITQILNEMIINEKEVNELQDKALGETRENIKKLEKQITDTNEYILGHEKKEEIIKEGIFKSFEELRTKLTKIKRKIKKLEIITIILFITNLTTIYLLWR